MGVPSQHQQIPLCASSSAILASSVAPVPAPSGLGDQHLGDQPVSGSSVAAIDENSGPLSSALAATLLAKKRLIFQFKAQLTAEIAGCQGASAAASKGLAI